MGYPQRVAPYSLLLLIMGTCCLPLKAQLPSRAQIDAALPAELETVVADGKPDAIVDAFYNKMWGAYADQPQKRIDLAQPYTQSKDPLVRFCAKYIIAETLDSQHNPEAPAHYAAMVEDEAAAHGALVRVKSSNVEVTDGFYEHWYGFILEAGNREEAHAVLLNACQHFMKEKRWGSTVASMYYQFTMKQSRPEEASLVLKVCDTYLEMRRSNPNKGVGIVEWVGQISERREVLGRALAGEKIPDFSALELITGTESADDRMRLRMVAAGGYLWVAWASGQGEGRALQVNPVTKVAKEVSGMSAKQLAVAAMGDNVYFGGKDGIYQLDLKGNIVRHLTEGTDALPARQIYDLCASDHNLYFTYLIDSYHFGIAVLNTETDKVTILTSSVPNARNEPIDRPSRLWWDAPKGRLIANDDGLGSTSRTAWAFKDGRWQSDTTYLTLTRGTETLTLEETYETPRKPFVGTLGTEAAMHFTGAKDSVLVLPELTKMPEPAWDAKHIWWPMQTGLYEINRQTGEKTWIAHQDQNPCLVAVEDHGVVFVATTHGIYRYIPK